MRSPKGRGRKVPNAAMECFCRHRRVQVLDPFTNPKKIARASCQRCPRKRKLKRAGSGGRAVSMQHKSALKHTDVRALLSLSLCSQGGGHYY